MMQLRIATQRDSDQIAALHTQSWRATYRGILSDNYLDEAIVNERLIYWQQYFNLRASNDQILFVAEQQQTLLGFVCLHLKEDPQWGTLIDNLHVSPSQKGKGIGKQLFIQAAQWILSKAPEYPVYLWVFEKNYLTRQFYEKYKGEAVERQFMLPVDKNSLMLINNTMSIRYCWKKPAILLEALGVVNISS